MRTKTTSIIIVSVLLAGVFLIAGCIPIAGPKTPKKSDVDLDCGGDYCSENFSKVVRVNNVDGKCVEEVTECEKHEICVADSTGVECEIRELAKLPCSENSKNTFLDPDGDNEFDPDFYICSDDCPVGFNCNNQCICECPEPVWTDPYWNAIQPDEDFDYFLNEWRTNREGLLDTQNIQGTINISGYRHERDGVTHYIPFYEMQLQLVENPDNEYIPQFGAWCVNDYYEAGLAMNLEHKWLNRPKQTCIWGGRPSFEGVLTLCPEDLVSWFDAYYK